MLVTPSDKGLLLFDLDNKKSKGVLFKNADLFVSYSNNELYYIEELPKKTKKSQGECNLVKCELDADLKPDIKSKTELNGTDFRDLNIDYSDNSKGNVLDSYLHDKNEDGEYDCVTIIRQGSLALTFQRNSE